MKIVEYNRNIRDLSRHHDTPYDNAVNYLAKKLEPLLNDNTEMTIGTNYLYFRYSNGRSKPMYKEIQFRGKRVLVVSYPYKNYKVLAELDRDVEDITNKDIDYIVERILNTSYFPKTFLKKD